MAKKKGTHEAFGEMVEETGDIGLPSLSLKVAAAAIVGERWSAAEARSVMARFAPNLQKKRVWDEADLVLLGAIFGLPNVQISTYASEGVIYAPWVWYFIRLYRAFDVTEKWIGQWDAIRFFTVPNARLGERPIDFLKHPDSFEKVLCEIVRECGTTMELVRKHLAY